MPELPEVEAVRRMLERATRGARIVRVELRRPDLRRPFPADFVSRLTGHTIRSISRRGKYLLAALSSGETLLVHLGMSGAFRIERTACVDRRHVTPADPHDHVVIDPVVGRRGDVQRSAALRPDGSDSRRDRASTQRFAGWDRSRWTTTFDAPVLARACAGKRVALKVLLLDQRLVAGVGNIYASEALHHARLSPRRRASTIATPAGAPREAAFRAGRRHQGGPAESGGRERTRLRVRPLPRLRTGRQAVPEARLRRNDPPHHAGGTVYLLLSGVSEVRNGAVRLKPDTTCLTLKEIALGCVLASCDRGLVGVHGF